MAHPQTVFDTAELARLQAARTVSHQTLAAVLKQTLDRYKTCNIIGPSATNSNCMGPFEGIAGYAMAALIFGGNQPDPDYSQYIGVAKRSLLAMANAPIPAPGIGIRNGDLEEAQYIRNLAIAYDVLHSQLSASDQAICRNALADAADHMATTASSAWWTLDLVNNHNWVNYAAIGLAGYALIGEDPRASSWITLALTNSDHLKFIGDLIVDGSWHEGIGYLAFGLSSSVPFWMASRQFHRPFGADDTAQLRNLGRYILAAQLPGNERVHIMLHGDWNWPQPSLVEVLQYAATCFRDPYAQEAARRWETDGAAAIGTVRSSIYERALYTALQYAAYDPAVPQLDITTVPLDLYASDQQAVIFRTGWDASSVVLGFKCGVMGGQANYERIKPSNPHNPNHPRGILNIGHDHVDDLSIWLYGRGGWFLTETPAYNCCNVTDTTGYTTEYHNSFLIDGIGQHGDERNSLFNPVTNAVKHSAVDHSWFFNRVASMPLHVSTTTYAFARGDGTQLYPPGANLNELKRTVVLSRDGYIALHDRLHLSSPHLIEQVFHFQLSAAQTGSVWIKGINEDNNVLGVRVFSPAAITVSIATQHSNGCYTLHSVCTSPPHQIDFSLVKVRPASNVSDVTFLELLWPTEEADWGARPNAQPLDANHPEYGFLLPLSSSGYNERWIYNTGRTTQAGGLTIQDAEIGIVRTDGAGTLERVALLGRGSLSEQTSTGSRTLLMIPMIPPGGPDGVAVEVIFSFSGRLADVSGKAIFGTSFFGPNVSEVWMDGQKASRSSWRHQGQMVVLGRYYIIILDWMAWVPRAWKWLFRYVAAHLHVEQLPWRRLSAGAVVLAVFAVVRSLWRARINAGVKLTQ